jgi:hypothetical protein
MAESGLGDAATCGWPSMAEGFPWTSAFDAAMLSEPTSSYACSQDLRSATGLGFGGSSTNLALDQIPICSVFCGIGSPQYRLTLAVDCSPIFVSGVTTSRSSCPIYSDNHHFEMD